MAHDDGLRMEEAVRDETSPAESIWRLRVRRVGREQQPLVIIDDFVADPEALFDEARAARFEAIAKLYPGVRAPVGPAYLETVLEPLQSVFKDVFGYQTDAQVQECFYSLVTTPAEALKPAQRLPHFDGVGDEKLAVLHYLCPARMGGTAFYRHRSTGWETVTSERFEAYRSAVHKDVERHGLPGASYVRSDTALFEQIDVVPARFNRTVIYRGVNLHAINLARDFDFGADPDSGRLTINTFVKPG